MPQSENESPAKRRKWPLWLLLAAFVLVVVSWVPGASDSMAETFEERVEELVIETNGRVEITSGESAQIQLRREWNLMARPAVDMHFEDGTLTVTSRCRPWIIIIRCQTNVDAVVAADAEVTVITSSGAVEVSGISGGTDLRTSAGAIEVANVAGDIRLRTSAGSIRGTVTTGNIEAQTSAGSIVLTVEESLEGLTAKSSAGPVDLTVPDEPYRVDFHTSAGQVELDVKTDPDSARFISATSSAGDITIRRAGS
jgi:hypothetical protein